MIKTVLAVVAAAALLAHPGALEAQNEIEGAWAFTLQSPEGTFNIPLTIVREGGELQARVGPGTVLFSGHETQTGVEFFWPLVYQGAELPTTLVGTFREGAWTGSADFNGLAEGTWEAKRPTASTTPAAAPAPNR